LHKHSKRVATIELFDIHPCHNDASKSILLHFLEPIPNPGDKTFLHKHTDSDKNHYIQPWKYNCIWHGASLSYFIFYKKNTKDFSGLHDKIYLPPSCRKVAKNISGDITHSVCLTPLYFFKHRNRSVIISVNISVSICIDWLIGWCLTSTLVVFQLYRGVPLYVQIWIMYIWQWCSMPNTVDNCKKIK
jgi:hypothetical protein